MVKNKVKFFKALGDETRLKIVKHLLSNREHCAGNLALIVKKNQTTVSKHLKILVEAEILKYKKKGKNIIYDIKNQQVKKLLLSLRIN
ncbi:MAG: metalloregulator ArsR/SmtB family transcription factor [Nanoarchaeota archaeon]|nr:metalloregulator ArsR/SmtB family transcription factor [Nanoarchaeota archaeon]